MTRTNMLGISIVSGLLAAFAASPVMASDGYESVNAITGPSQSSDDRGYESINAVTGPVSRTPQSPVDRRDGYSSPNALVGAEPTTSSVVEVSESGGFDWGDAMIGALAGAALIPLVLGGARLVSQSRRRTVESSA